MMAQQTGEEKTKIFSNIRQIGLVEVLLDEADGRESALTPALRFKRMKQTGTPTEGAIDQIIADEKNRRKHLLQPECAIGSFSFPNARLCRLKRQSRVCRKTGGATATKNNLMKHEGIQNEIESNRLSSKIRRHWGKIQVHF
jgi:hypothetical protein